MLTNAYGQEVEPFQELDPDELTDYCERYGIPWGQKVGQA